MKTQHDFSNEEEAGFRIAQIMQRKGAAFVVRACNSHTELVEALAKMTDHAEEVYPHFESERGRRDIKQAHDALAQAREVAQ